MRVQAQVLLASALDLVEDATGHLPEHLSLVLDGLRHLILLGLVSLLAAIVGLVALFSSLLLLSDFNRSVASRALRLAR